MPVPSAITDLSTTAGSNSPAGTDPIGTDADNYIRAHAAFIAQLRDGSKNLEAGTATAPSIAFTGDANTGIYSSAADTVSVAAGGTKVAEFSNSVAAHLVNSASSTAVYSDYKTNGTTKGYIGTDGNGILSTGTGTAFGIRSESDLLLMAGQADAWRIDSTGRLKNVGNTQPSLSAYCNTSRTTAGVFTTWSTENHDQGNTFNTSTGVFTAPVAGVYQVNLVISASVVGQGSVTILVRKNTGSTSVIATTSHWGTSTVYAGASGLIRLAANDTLDVYFSAFNTSSGSLSSSYVTEFSVHLLG